MDVDRLGYIGVDSIAYLCVEVVGKYFAIHLATVLKYLQEAVVAEAGRRAQRRLLRAS